MKAIFVFLGVVCLIDYGARPFNEDWAKCRAEHTAGYCFAGLVRS